MATQDPPSGTVRPGGRTARTAAAAHDAVRGLLAERGREGLTMREVAARSGVHEATLYRRWRDVDTLVLDAATERITRESPVPDTGSLRGDLHGWAASVAADIVRPGGFALFETLARVDLTGTGGDDDVVRRREQAREYIARRYEQLAAAIERARTRGETAPEPADVLDRLIAPLYLRVGFGYRPADHDLDALVDDALRT
jgi:AcrR family transcriptional regulator